MDSVSIIFLKLLLKKHRYTWHQPGTSSFKERFQNHKCSKNITPYQALFFSTSYPALSGYLIIKERFHYQEISALCQVNFLHISLKCSYYMLKAAWLRCLNGAAFASLKKISCGFFSITPSA